ncbi:MAG: hypothetical protein R6V77_04000 [Candidatus Cloacimonadaceae bacterium]
MDISDLVEIGRLGRLEPDGFYNVQISQSNKSIFDRIQQCYLIFSSHRVFFVTVVKTKTFGKRTYLSFKEDGIAEEMTRHANVVVALAKEDLTDTDDESEVSSLFGYKVSFDGVEIGHLSGAMVSSMQSVFVIELLDGRELMVPNVEMYVVHINRRQKTVILQNIEQLLELCTSTS